MLCNTKAVSFTYPLEILHLTEIFYTTSGCDGCDKYQVSLICVICAFHCVPNVICGFLCDMCDMWFALCSIVDVIFGFRCVQTGWKLAKESCLRC